MKRYQRYLEKLHTHIQQDWDRIIPVIGPEGVGKSTLILQSIWLYEQARSHTPTPETVLNHVVFDDRNTFRNQLLAADPGDPIAVMDAAHVLYNKDVMMPDQKEVEKSLLDIRTENYVIFLGYQDWTDIPRQLRKRRAENAIYIPTRGRLHGFNRNQLDDKYQQSNDNGWPDPALIDTFPSLEGTRLWTRFDEIDRERKRRRLHVDDDSEENEPTPQSVAQEILQNSPEEYLDQHEVHNRWFINKALIRYDYPSLSDQQATQVKAAIERQVDVETLATQVR